MKKAMLMGWNFLASWLLLMAIFFVLTENSFVIRIWWKQAALLSTVLIAACHLAWFRKNPARCATVFFSIYYGIIALVLYGILTMMYFRIGVAWLWIAVLIFGMLMSITGAIYLHKKWKWALLGLAFALLMIPLTVYISVLYEKAMVRHYFTQWGKEPWAINPDALAIDSDTVERLKCDSSQSAERSSLFSQSFSDKTNDFKEEVWKYFRNGGDYKPLILLSQALDSNARKSFEFYRSRLCDALSTQPHKPLHQIEKEMFQTKDPDFAYLEMSNWVPAAFMSIILESLAGRNTEAMNDRRIMHNLALCAIRSPQGLCDFHETRYLITNELGAFAFILTTAREPLSDEDIQALDEVCGDFSWFASLIEAEKFRIAQACGDDWERFPYTKFGEMCFIHRPMGMATHYPILLKSKAYQRYLVLPACKDNLEQFTEWSIWLHTVPDLANHAFKWKEFKAHKGLFKHYERFTYDGPDDYYSYLLNLYAQRNLLQGFDLVLRFFKERQELPSDATEFRAAWPIDPFSEKPMRYERLSASKFRIFSIGPDELGWDNKPYTGDDIVLCMDMNDR